MHVCQVGLIKLWKGPAVTSATYIALDESNSNSVFLLAFLFLREMLNVVCYLTEDVYLNYLILTGSLPFIHFLATL